MQRAADQIRRKLGGKGPIVFVSGNFNILHPGHLRLLSFAAEVGGPLVVGVNADDTVGVTMAQADRLAGIRAIGAVAEAVALAEPAENFISRFKPEIVVKGLEYAGQVNPEQSAVEAYGGRLVFSSGEARFASRSLLEREYSETQFSAIRKPADYPARNDFRVVDLARLPPRFAKLRVVVVGDLIVDEYISCDPLGMSQEDPTIVVSPIESKMFVGGAGIVAAHARGLGAQARYFGVVGNDESATFARDALQRYGVAAELFVDSTRPTTRKQRYRAWGKTLLRVNHVRQHEIEPDQQQRFLESVSAALGDADVLLFSDFNYGCLPQRLVEALADRARKHNVMMAADSQASSQLSDIARFRGMSLITPTEREARLALRDADSGLVILADRLQKAADAGHVVVTLGAEGLLIHGRQGDSYRTERLPAFNAVPKDVAGAGDSFFICTTLALRAGADIWTAAYLGSLAAACQVSRVGNLPLTVNELLTEIAYPAG
jgi:rfaE bifunctional protein kinase chain/domain